MALLPIRDVLRYIRAKALLRRAIYAAYVMAGVPTAAEAAAARAQQKEEEETVLLLTDSRAMNDRIFALKMQYEAHASLFFTSYTYDAAGVGPHAPAARRPADGRGNSYAARYKASIDRTINRTTLPRLVARADPLRVAATWAWPDICAAARPVVAATANLSAATGGGGQPTHDLFRSFAEFT
ncbi:hypothetical protein STCU_11215 [Strigomonas culicis]|uniref:Uncharacterized protein n=1 Tax=Strigomonas culicis TaxID=28005 RepID=S9UP72_9TRYP|nr:hypothetical protein STCU_11215 [Strigomonas culicis]|eukprot:EPY16481.1 hypothetical protein STCU_11215 [Strigomonas culicis]